jgi:hypothetical protein
MGDRRRALSAGAVAPGSRRTPDGRARLRLVLRLGLSLAVVVGMAAAPLGSAARAAPPTLVALEYEVAPEAAGCPGADEFRASVGRQLGYDPFRPSADRRVAVQIARKEPGFDGRIRWSDAEGRWVGERRWSSRRQECDEIAASLAFSVAVQVQLLATLAPATPAPAAAPAAPPPAPAAPAPADGVAARPTPPPAPPPRGPRLQLSLGLGPSLAVGLGPQPTALGRLFVAGRLAWASLEIAVDAALPTTRHEVDGSGFSLDRYAATAAACGHARALAACLLGTLGVLQARGFGVDAPSAPAGLFSQAGARIAATRDFGDRYFGAARVDALVMLGARNVTLNETVAWTTPRVGALLGLDFGARF